MLSSAVATAGQQPASAPPDDPEQVKERVEDRILALQREADRLAGQSRSLLSELRKLEIERELQIARVTAADAEVAEAEAALAGASDRLTALENERVAALPDLRARLVDLYKHGRGGYMRVVLAARNLRELGRATRAVTSLASLNQRRIDAHRRRLETLRQERQSLADAAKKVQERRQAAVRARVAAERAIAARTAMLEDIDRRRDLTAQLAGELQVAQRRLSDEVAKVAAGAPAESMTVPLAPFRGALEWPVAGRVIGEFGELSGRAGDGSVRNGIEIAVPEGTPVRAVHSGTVGFADSFTGYGTLVILDHGGEDYSLYGFLSAAEVRQGERVQAGDQLGRVGTAPTGPAALYFEMRVDGRSVDPVQWLKRR